MPSLVEMPELKAVLGGKPVVVPGGWFAEVPIVERIERESHEALAAYFQANGMLPMKADDRALWTVQKTLETAYKKHHGDAVRRYAKIYARRYPHLWDRETGLLAGFDAARIATCCQPWEQVTQRRKAIVRLRMEEMALGARRAA